MGEIRFVGTGVACGYPYLVCKKCLSVFLFDVWDGFRGPDSASS